MSNWKLGFIHNDFFNVLKFAVLYSNKQLIDAQFFSPKKTSVGENVYVLEEGKGDKYLVTAVDEIPASTQESNFAALINDQPVVGESLVCMRFRLREGLPAVETVMTSTVVSVEELEVEGVFCVKTQNSTYICAKNSEQKAF